MNNKSLRCSICSQVVEDHQLVQIDYLNTITHLDCNPDYDTAKDSGTFAEIQEKYRFFGPFLYVI